MFLYWYHVLIRPVTKVFLWLLLFEGDTCEAVSNAAFARSYCQESTGSQIKCHHCHIKMKEVSTREMRQSKKKKKKSDGSDRQEQKREEAKMWSWLTLYLWPIKSQCPLKTLYDNQCAHNKRPHWENIWRAANEPILGSADWCLWWCHVDQNLFLTLTLKWTGDTKSLIGMNLSWSNRVHMLYLWWIGALSTIIVLSNEISSCWTHNGEVVSRQIKASTGLTDRLIWYFRNYVYMFSCIKLHDINNTTVVSVPMTKIKMDNALPLPLLYKNLNKI